MWLDRGELDKLIERAAAEIQPAPVSQPRAPEPPPRQESHYKDPYKDHYKHSHKEHYNKDYYKGHYGHRKKSLLGELFDF